MSSGIGRTSVVWRVPILSLAIGSLTLASGVAAGLYDADAQTLTRGAVSEHDPYGALVPLHVLPNVKVLDPANIPGIDLAPQTQAGIAPATFTHTAWIFPHRFENPAPNKTSPDPAPALPAPSERLDDRPRPPMVSPRPADAPAPLKRSAPKIIRTKSSRDKFPSQKLGQPDAAPWVAMPQVLAPTAPP